MLGYILEKIDLSKAKYDAYVDFANKNNYVLRERTDYFIATERPAVGTKIYKPLDTEEKNYFYADCAAWCGFNNCTITEHDAYYEITKLDDSLPELNAYKQQRKEELAVQHEIAENEAHITSSLGFEIDANERANRDINGLLITISDNKTVQFMDYYNKTHEVNRDQLLTMQKEVIANAQNLYEQKWNYRNLIDNAVSSKDLYELDLSLRILFFLK